MALRRHDPALILQACAVSALGLLWIAPDGASGSLHSRGTSCCRQSPLLGILRPRGYAMHICSATLIHCVNLLLQACTAKMNLSEEVDLEDYVGRPDKISNAEISAICQEAGMHAVRKNRLAGQSTGGQSSSCQCAPLCVCLQAHTLRMYWWCPCILESQMVTMRAACLHSCHVWQGRAGGGPDSLPGWLSRASTGTV